MVSPTLLRMTWAFRTAGDVDSVLSVVFPLCRKATQVSLRRFSLAFQSCVVFVDRDDDFFVNTDPIMSRNLPSTQNISGFCGRRSARPRACPSKISAFLPVVRVSDRLFRPSQTLTNFQQSKPNLDKHDYFILQVQQDQPCHRR